MKEDRVFRFCIAEHHVVIRTDVGTVDIEALLPNLAPFRCEGEGEALFDLHIVGDADDSGEYRNIGDFDTGNGHILVDKCDATGGYRFLIRDVRRREVAQMWATADFAKIRCRLLCEAAGLRHYAINNVLMMAYAFAGAKRATLLVHASCVMVGDTAYAFTAKSGTGKSTQTGNWLKCFADAELLNDDNPIVRVKDDGVYIYGSPWSGKTPCYRNVRARLGAMATIVRDSRNYVVRHGVPQALSAVVAACSTMRWDDDVYRGVIDTVADLLTQVGVYALHCTADAGSAVVCRAALAPQ